MSAGAEHVSSGVEGLDQILGGGIVRGHIVLVAGNPGSGKTTLASQFVYEGTKKGEPGVYLSFVEPRNDYYRNLRKLGIDLEEAEAKGLFEYVEAPSFIDPDSLATVLADVLNAVNRLGAKRLVIDSISAVTSVLTKPETRSLLHTGLLKPLKLSGVTTLLIAELPYGAAMVGHGVEEFVVDDVIILELREEKGLLKRLLRIPKSRGAEIKYYSYEFVIGRGGVHVMLPLDPRFRGRLEKEKASTGVAGLDALLDGGIRYNSNVLVVGPEGIGKSMLLMTMACAFSRRGETVVYVSLEESKEQILSLLDEMCGSEHTRRIHVFATPPNALTMGQWLYYTRASNEQLKPRLVIIDGVAALEKHFGGEHFVDLIRDFTLLTKGSYQILVLSAVPRIYSLLSTLVDVIVKMWYAGEDRKLRIVKARGTKCDTAARSFVITSRGVEVVPG